MGADTHEIGRRVKRQNLFGPTTFVSTTTACAALLGMLAATSYTLAQATLPTTRPAANFALMPELRGKNVDDIRIFGNSQVPTAVISNVIRTREGQPFDPQTVEEDYERIFSLRKFANVEAKVEPTADGVIVVFVVTEQKQITSVSFRGNFKINTIELQDEAGMQPGESIDRFRIALARQSIETFYREKNYPFAHVDVPQEPLTSRGELIFDVVEGPNVRIRKIAFPGATSFSNWKLKDQVKSSYWIWIFRPGTYNAEQIEEDVASLRRFYEGKGFFDVRVGRQLVWSPDMTELQINYVVDEGVRYTIDRVTFNGLKLATEEKLRTNLKLVEGLAYDADILQRDVRQLIREYSPLGLVYQPASTSNPNPDYLQINPRTIFRREPGKVEVVYDINEGSAFRLGRIIVRGNAKTQDKVILRETRMEPGQLYNSAEVSDATDRLRGTPYFSNVQITPIGDDPEVRDLLIEVSENRTASLNFGAGINSNGGVGANVTYEQRNFDATAWPDSWNDILNERAFTGAGQNFRISLEPGTESTNASIRFTEPYIFDQPYSFTGEAYYRTREREVYEDTRLGGRMTLGKRFDYNWSASLTLRYENINIGDIEDDDLTTTLSDGSVVPVRAPEILGEEGSHNLLTVGPSIRRDTTNRGRLLYRGMNTVLGWERALPIGDDQYDYDKVTLSHDMYYTLGEDLLDRKTILTIRGDAGWIANDAPFFERFYAGGLGSIRGFDFRGVSPRSGPEDDRIGGNFSLTGTVEVSYPLVSEVLRGVVFTDFGTVESDVKIGTLRSSVGAGVRLTLPFPGFESAPLALDFAWPITKDDQDDTQFISFSFGLFR